MAQEFLTVQEAKQEFLIPAPFHPYFTDSCTWCGEPMVINRTRTVLCCGNPYCVRRVGNQAAALLKDLGYKGYGPEKLTAYCRSMGIYSIIDFLCSPPLPLNPLEDLNKLAPTFPTLIEMLHIPNIGSKAHKIFGKFDSLSDMVEKLEGAEGIYQHIIKALGGQESTAQFIATFNNYIQDINDITQYVTVSPQASSTVLVEITGHITRVRDDNGNSLTKDMYIRALNQLAKPIGMEFLRSSKFTQLKFMIADSPSNSRKYLIGAQRGILVTSDKLLSVVNEMVSRKCEQEENGHA